MFDTLQINECFRAECAYECKMQCDLFLRLGSSIVFNLLHDTLVDK